MSRSISSDRLGQLKSILAFFIGIFGALAILGVFFKILKLDNYIFFMKVGFIGEAAAFVTMGVFELIGGFAGKSATAQSSAGRTKTSVKELETRIKSEVDSLFLALGEDVRHFQQEVRQLAAEMELARTTIHGMRAELDSVATGRLADDAGQLGAGMSQLGEEMRVAGSSVQRIRAELEDVAERFARFNQPSALKDRPPRPSARRQDGVAVAPAARALARD